MAVERGDALLEKLVRLPLLEKEPDLRDDGSPIWWHPLGNEMSIERFDPSSYKAILIISHKTAMVTITKIDQEKAGVPGYYVDWEVNAPTSPERSFGSKLHFTAEELAIAFCLTDGSGKIGRDLMLEFGADAAKKRKFIRWNQFLNIPCAGTGKQGELYVSIHLSDEMKTAIRRIL